MTWKTTKPTQIPADSVIQTPDVRLSVGPAHGTTPEQWQYLDMTFGAHSMRSHNECLETWPKEAIARARKALDDLETLLKGQDE